MSAGTDVDALASRSWRSRRGGVVQIAEFWRIHIRRKNINPCTGAARKITPIGTIIWVIVIPVVIVHVYRQGPLVHIAETGGGVSLLPGLVQGRQQHRRQDADNGNDDKQLNECESLPGLPFQPNLSHLAHRRTLLSTLGRDDLAR